MPTVSATNCFKKTNERVQSIFVWLTAVEFRYLPTDPHKIFFSLFPSQPHHMCNNKAKHNEPLNENSLVWIYIDYSQLTSITSRISLVGRDIRYDFT